MESIWANVDEITGRL